MHSLPSEAIHIQVVHGGKTPFTHTLYEYGHLGALGH